MTEKPDSTSRLSATSLSLPTGRPGSIPLPEALKNLLNRQFEAPEYQEQVRRLTDALVFTALEEVFIALEAAADRTGGEGGRFLREVVKDLRGTRRLGA